MRTFWMLMNIKSGEWLPEDHKGYTWSELTSVEPPRLFKSERSAIGALAWWKQGPHRVYRVPSVASGWGEEVEESGPERDTSDHGKALMADRHWAMPHVRAVEIDISILVSSLWKPETGLPEMGCKHTDWSIAANQDQVPEGETRSVCMACGLLTTKRIV